MIIGAYGYWRVRRWRFCLAFVGAAVVTLEIKHKKRESFQAGTYRRRHLLESSLKEIYSFRAKTQAAEASNLLLLKPSRRETPSVPFRLLPGHWERDSNTDSHALERDTMRTQDGGTSGWGFIGVFLIRRLKLIQTWLLIFHYIMRTTMNNRVIEIRLGQLYSHACVTRETWTYLMHFKWEGTWTHGNQPNRPTKWEVTRMHGNQARTFEMGLRVSGHFD